jgi:hypothetical protein
MTVDHLAGIAVRQPEIVAVGGRCGMTIRTCVTAESSLNRLIKVTRTARHTGILAVLDTR